MMKKTLAFIFAATAAFAAESAFAIGAVYEVPATVELIASSSGSNVTATLSGTLRNAVSNQASTSAATNAALRECQSQAANPQSSFFDGLMTVEVTNGVRVTGSVGNVVIAASGCTTPATFADNEYAAFVVGITLNSSGNSGTFGVFHAVNSNRNSAISQATAACRSAYSSNSCELSDVYRGQPVAASSDDDNDTALYIGSGVVAVGLLAWYFWDGNPLAFSFSPDGGYEMTESGYSYHAGGRMDFRQDEWHLYWTANVGDKGLGYASGGEWQKDIWRAAFSERVAGEVADYNFSLSAKYDGGVWEVAPAYRLHSRLQNGESETDNSLNLEGVLLWNRWAIKPSAGFQWRNAEDFGDTAKFGFSAVRNL